MGNYPKHRIMTPPNNTYEIKLKVSGLFFEHTGLVD